MTATATALTDRVYVADCLESAAEDLTDAVIAAAAAASIAAVAQAAGSADLPALVAELNDAAAQVLAEAQQVLRLARQLAE